MAIDELLQSRGELRLIQGQPLYPLRSAVVVQPPTKKPKQAAEAVQEYLKKQATAKAAMPVENGHERIPGSSKVPEPSSSTAEQAQQTPNRWWGPIVPPHPGPDLTYQA